MRAGEDCFNMLAGLATNADVSAAKSAMTNEKTRAPKDVMMGTLEQDERCLAGVWDTCEDYPQGHNCQRSATATSTSVNNHARVKILLAAEKLSRPLQIQTKSVSPHLESSRQQCTTSTVDQLTNFAAYIFEAHWCRSDNGER